MWGQVSQFGPTLCNFRYGRPLRTALGTLCAARAARLGVPHAPCRALALKPARSGDTDEVAAGGGGVGWAARWPQLAATVEALRGQERVLAVMVSTAVLMSGHGLLTPVLLARDVKVNLAPLCVLH